MLPVPNRRLPPDEEDKLWVFIHKKLIVDKLSGNISTLLNEYEFVGKFWTYFSIEIYDHFFNVMMPRLHKTNALDPRQILEIYKELAVPIQPSVEKILNMFCTEPIELNEQRCLVGWTLNQAAPSQVSLSRRGARVEVPWRVEVAMWKHIARNSHTLTAVDIESLRFWRELEIDEPDTTPQILLDYFLCKVRYTLFALKLELSFKMQLIRDMRIKLTDAEKRWLFRIDKVFVDVNNDGTVKRWRVWTLEDENDENNVTFPGYVPLRVYGTPLPTTQKIARLQRRLSHILAPVISRHVSEHLFEDEEVNFFDDEPDEEVDIPLFETPEVPEIPLPQTSMILSQTELAEKCHRLNDFIRRSEGFKRKIVEIPRKKDVVAEIVAVTPDSMLMNGQEMSHAFKALNEHMLWMENDPTFAKISDLWNNRHGSNTTNRTCELRAVKKEPEQLPTEKVKEIAGRKRPFGDLDNQKDVLLVTLSEADELVAPTTPKVPCKLTFRKKITPNKDILKMVNEFQKPPIVYNENGISFVRADQNVEMTIEDRSKKAIIEMRQQKDSQNSEALRKCRGQSPLCSPGTKRARMSSEPRH